MLWVTVQRSWSSDGYRLSFMACNESEHHAGPELLTSGQAAKRQKSNRRRKNKRIFFKGTAQ